jgi:hypothetical protein
MTLAIISGDRDIIRENYVLLADELDSTLSLDNIGELFSADPVSDLLGALMVKIDSAKQIEDLDYDTQNELKELEDEISESITIAFSNEFPDLADVLNTEFNETSKNPLVEFIYKYFYIKRREVCLNYLLEKTLSAKSSFIKKYKTGDIKRDLGYQTAKSEMKDLKNPEHYILLLAANDIIADLLGDDNLNIHELLTMTDMEEDELEISLVLCDNDSGVLAMNTIYNSLINSNYLDEFRSAFKNALFNRLVMVN